MIKYCYKKWAENCDNLKEKITELVKSIRGRNYGWRYEDLFSMIVENIFGKEYDKDDITVIDNGECQGTMLFLVPRDVYQPSECDYLMSYVGYGSCSGCDTLESVLWDSETEDEKINGLYSICANIVANTTKPYNYGWRYDEEYEQLSKEE